MKMICVLFFVSFFRFERIPIRWSAALQHTHILNRTHAQIATQTDTASNHNQLNYSVKVFLI